MAQVEGRAKAGQPIEKALPTGGKNKPVDDKESMKMDSSCVNGQVSKSKNSMLDHRNVCSARVLI